jgi:hypothetical protein
MATDSNTTTHEPRTGKPMPRLFFCRRAALREHALDLVEISAKEPDRHKARELLALALTYWSASREMKPHD